MLKDMNLKFDRWSFWAAIAEARGRVRSDDPIRSYVRERGLRFLVQARWVIPLDRVMGLVREAWGPPGEGDAIRVESLFQLDAETALPDHLAVFSLVTIEGVDIGDLRFNVYDACYALMQHPDIVSVEPDLPFLGFSDNGITGRQGKSQPKPIDKAWALRQMGVDAAWQNVPPQGGRTMGAGVKVAHLDSGWTDHEDLDRVHFAPSGIRDFISGGKGDGSDPMNVNPVLNPGHGTRTGSVIMSRGGISAYDTTQPGQITGVAPEATYVPKRCVRSVVVVYGGDIARGVWHSTTTDCHVISMSLGGFPSSALRTAIQDAVANNLLVVAAAGNKVPRRMVVWPAAYPECIAMAATNTQRQPWDLSSRGRAIDMSAPGVNVWVAEPKKAPAGVCTGSGTSYATAHMAGVAALWLAFFGRTAMLSSLKPGVFLQEVFREHVKRTAQVPHGWLSSRYGAGIVAADALLASSPTMAVPLGFGLPKHPSLLGCPIPIELSRPFMRAASGRHAALLPAFEHELQSIALLDGHPLLGTLLGNTDDAQKMLSVAGMSQALKRWLHLD